MDAIRYAEKLVSADGLTTYTFPTDGYEYQAEQGYRRATAAVLGADYAHDFLGAYAWPKDLGEEAIRFVIWGATAAAAETEFDTLLQELRQIGLGKLYALASDGTRRWAWAKLDGRPSYVVNADSFFNIPVALKLVRFSDWFGSTVTGSQLCNASPTSWTVTNPGTAKVRNLVLRLRSNAASGFTNPSVSNAANGQSVASSRDAVSANSELKIDCERYKVQFSDDDGATYSDDYSLVSLGATQVALLELEPGDNLLSYSDGGTPNVTIEWSFDAPYE